MIQLYKNVSKSWKIFFLISKLKINFKLSNLTDTHSNCIIYKKDNLDLNIKIFSNELLDLVKRKYVYLYECIDSADQQHTLKKTKLPGKKVFIVR